ncbi:caspase family protein [Xanthobacter sp. AM11]|uniref:caspase family protein n=1 Tax=Xanthobacter sp. AM11 TaxID=3380643 RepID=UPI0039BF2FA6
MVRGALQWRAVQWPVTPRHAGHLLAGVALLLGLLGPQLAAARNLALLVGVADYDEPKIRPLAGPRNDVILLWRHLSRHGFDADDITVLAEGLPQAAHVPRPQAAPTRAAIMQGLARLAQQAGPGDTVMFHFSGHGTTQPQAAPAEGAVPEAGGRDQVLLPKDAGLYDPAARTIRNAIIDDELGTALDRIRAKGATVFVVVDACHAGTVTRSADMARGVDAAALGAPQAGMGAVLSSPPRLPIHAPQRGGTLRAAGAPAPAGMGALVAFFAVDSWTPAIERAYPAPAAGLVEKPGADGAAQAIFGVFSWHLLRSFESGRAVTFRDLARMVSLDVAAAAQLAHAPLPVFEGDLDRTLPGAAANGPRRFATRQEGGDLLIEAGALQGFDEGAEIALFDGPLADAQPLGTVLMPGTTAGESRVPLADLPPGAAAGSVKSLWAQMERPGVVFRFRVANVALPEAAQAIARALEPGEGMPAIGIELVAPDQPADLNLHLVDGRLWMVPEGGRLVRDPQAYGRSFSLPADTGPAPLRNAVWAFARAANLVRLASVADMGAGAASGDVEISLDLIRETDGAQLADPRRRCTQAARPSPPLPVDSGVAAPLAHCDTARLTITNRSERDMDLGIFFLDPLGGIDVPVRGWRQNGCIATLPARASGPLVVRTTLTTWGKDGPSQTGLHRILVFALPRAGGIPPSLCHLLQRDVASASAGALRGTGQRGFLDLLGRAARVAPGLRAANPFEAEDSAAGSVVVRQFSLDLLAPEASR